MSRYAMMASVVLTACTSTSGTDQDAIDVVGRWSYSAIQSTPILEITGQIVIEEQNKGTIAGELQAQERDPQGIIRNRIGVVHGRVLGASAVDFDVLYEATARRHVGRIQGDSITGTWAEPTGATPLTGSFRARRVKP